jgi:hypothetical protein
MKDKQRHGIPLHTQLSITMDNFLFTFFSSNFSSNNATFLTILAATQVQFFFGQTQLLIITILILL